MTATVDDRWFSTIRDEFASYCKPYRGRSITYVEIGCWEGASAAWVAKHVLTHAQSRGIGIDPYRAMVGHTRCHSQDAMTSRKRIAQQAVESAAPRCNWTWIYEDSTTALKQHAWLAPIDLLYIDGQHHAADVIRDFCLAFDSLSIGATVIFDDYAVGMRKKCAHVPEAIAAISTCFAGLVETLPGGQQQRAIRKLADSFDRSANEGRRAWRRAKRLWRREGT